MYTLPKFNIAAGAEYVVETPPRGLGNDSVDVVVKVESGTIRVGDADPVSKVDGYAIGTGEGFSFNIDSAEAIVIHATSPAVGTVSILRAGKRPA